jgi:hypothetical protein
MKRSSDELDYNELKAELQALRKKVDDLDDRQTGLKSVTGFARRWRLSKGMVFRLLLPVGLLALVIGAVAAGSDNALFISPQGYVGINHTKPEAPLDVNGNALVRGDLKVGGKLVPTGGVLNVDGKLVTNGDAAVGGAIEAGNSDLYFTNPNHEHSGKGNTPGYAAIENSKGYNSLMILGRMSDDRFRYIGLWDKVGIGMGMNDKPRAALDVRGDMIADNVWVKLHDGQLRSSADYTIQGINGDAYRRFRIEVEGKINVAGSDKVIGLRPNGSTVNYGPESIHWQGHAPNSGYAHSVAWFGATNSLLPLCATHWGQDGQIVCTGEMNTHTGMFRMINSNSVFNTSGRCGSSSCIISDNAVNSWRDETANITSLTLYFNGASGFSGRLVLYGKK